jgi:hypothetical protein
MALRLCILHVGPKRTERALSEFCSARTRAEAPLAQSAERLHGKEKVYGSIP